MPVSYLPCFSWLLLLGFPFLFLRKGKRSFWRATAFAAGLAVAFLLSVFVPGWLLWVKAVRGDAESQYELARWTENHCEQIQRVLLWPCSPDVLGSYVWLERSAGQDYPPALFVLGVRLKYGYHVPQPENWQGPEGNFLPQPERGQVYIDRALALGFRPGMAEQYYCRIPYRR